VAPIQPNPLQTFSSRLKEKEKKKKKNKKNKKEKKRKRRSLSPINITEAFSIILRNANKRLGNHMQNQPSANASILILSILTMPFMKSLH